MFCLAVDPERRRQGLAVAVLTGLLDSLKGAELSYLQVESRNEIARAFFAQLGFSEVYRYARRRGPAPAPGALR